VIWLFVIGTKEILQNKLTSEKFLRQQILLPLCKAIAGKDIDGAQIMADAIKLPSTDVLTYILSCTQKNNGSQLISSTYLFFEILTNTFVSLPSQINSYFTNMGQQSFGFKVDMFEL
jgi:hypothetical protein